MQNESVANAALKSVASIAMSNVRDSPPDSPSLNFARHTGDKLSAQFIGFSGIAGFFMAWALAQCLGISEKPHLILLFFGFTALPMILLNVLIIKTHQRTSSGLLHGSSQFSYRRLGTKLLGIALTIGMVFFLYWLFPEYSRDFYQPVWIAIWMVALPAVIGTAIYVAWVDVRMVDPFDGFWHTGLIILGRWRECNITLLQEHFLGWLVKGFFFPLMAAGAAKTLSGFVTEGIDFANFGGLYSTSINLIYAVDVSFGAIGYLLTLRVLDAHNRSVETTALGWASTVVCYVPISTFVWTAFLKYKGNIEWHDWLINSPILYVSWGFLIVLLLVVYVWATVSFGCRFSNLTNRGIIVDGPYRFMKHPAYVSKNLAWWMLYIPFAAHGTLGACVKACICLLLTNLIYFIRAKTEERHLTKDAAYNEYSRWVKRNGLLAQLRLLVSREKYS